MTTMKCLDCGAALKGKRETVRPPQLGLPNVVLQDIDVFRCSKCGYSEIAIPRIEGLHQLLATRLVRKPARLTPEEIVFLRKYLGWSSADFARRMGTAPETVSRWEHGTTPMGTTADRLLRMLVLSLKPVERYDDAELVAMATQSPKPLKVQLRPTKTGWRSAA